MLSAIKNLRISTKIMLAHAAVLVCLLFITSMLTVGGIYFTVYHEAEMEMERSITAVRERAQLLGDEKVDLRNGRGEALPRFLVGLHRSKALIPGVILRVMDNTGKLIFDSNTYFPSVEDVEAATSEESARLGKNELIVVTMENLVMCYEKSPININGNNYDLYFFRTITAERQFLQMLRNALLFTNGIGIILALLAGYFVSSHTLKPIRTITQAAKGMEIAGLSSRLVIPQVKDELSELMETFNHMIARLEAGFEQQRRFVSDASHELRTPVTVISGYAQMLLRWGKDDEETLKEGLSAISSEADDMQNLIEKLLFLARADQRKQVIKKEMANLHEVIKEVGTKAKYVINDHNFELKENDEGFAQLDIVLFKQMVRVFIENAIKYTPKGGKITLSSRRVEDKMAIMISDTGIGIAEEHLDKVFERFYRIDSSRTKSEGGVGGSGLGLSIASWIAKNHDIEIKVESEENIGTRFTLFVPLC